MMSEFDISSLREIVKINFLSNIAPYLQNAQAAAIDLNNKSPLFAQNAFCCAVVKKTGAKKHEPICGKTVKVPRSLYCSMCAKKIAASAPDKMSINLVKIGNPDEKHYWNPANDQIYEMEDDEKLFLVGKRKGARIEYSVTDADIMAARALGIACECSDE